MSSVGVETNFNVSTNLHDLVKKILLAFCEVHVSFKQRLDIYGSIHVRSDDSDLTCFILNEHSYKQLNLNNEEQDLGLMRYVSTINGNSVIETVCHQNSKLSGPDSVKKPSKNFSQSIAEFDARNSLLHETNKGAENQKFSTLSSNRTSEGSKTHPATQSARTIANNLVSDEDEQNCDVQQSTSEIPEAKTSAEAEMWPESTLDAVDNPSSLALDEPKPSNYLKTELEQDGLGAVKLEPASENDIIDLGSDEEGYEQSSEGMLTFDSSAYDNSGLYPGYSSSSVTNVPSDIYSQAAWIRSNVNYLPQSESQFSLTKQNSSRPPPQKFCSFCMKCFATNVQLRLHIQRYHSEPSVMEGCANTNWNRLQSMSSVGAGSSDNSSDKKLTCSICMLSFRSLDGLRCHENSKHSRNKLYNCRFCSQVFLTRQAAYTHRIKFHRLKVKKTDSGQN